MADVPNSIDAVKADAKMMGYYLKYAKRRLMLNEVMFYFDKGNAQALFPKYIDPKSGTAANIDGEVIGAAQKLAKAGDWSNAAWPKLIAAGKNTVKAALNPDLGSGFARSDEYKDYLKTEKMGSPAKAAKVLGVKDVKKLTQAMEAIVTGDKAKGTKLLNEIMVKEVIGGKVDELVKVLEKQGLV